MTSNRLSRDSPRVARVGPFSPIGANRAEAGQAVYDGNHVCRSGAEGRYLKRRFGPLRGVTNFPGRGLVPPDGSKARGGSVRGLGSRGPSASQASESAKAVFEIGSNQRSTTNENSC